jgi:8-oxo-dGTP diphosphatase
VPKPKTPLLTVDCVVFDALGRVLLVRRKHAPFKGALALPGGFVDIGETVEAACRRELLEETGIKVGRISLVGVYSEPGRDPRGHICSVAFWAFVGTARPIAGDDAGAAEWVSGWRRARLAFDHHMIVTRAWRQQAARAKAEAQTKVAKSRPNMRG